ncbi:MAG TPA: VWA domain-containing protein [Pyrinomonadaceae bacterium]|nr:VWA domain-containing protein [Pyrinomonadaceae bacterium]
MSTPSFSLKPYLLAALLCCCPAAIAPAQDRQTPQGQSSAREIEDDETIRINTELIQMGVTVFDKQGRFVDKLKREDFELRVDGKPVSVSFFESAGGESDGGDKAATAGPEGLKQGAANEALDEVKRRGRAVIFFIDDLHFAPDSYKRAKDMIQRFIDRDVESDDQVAITSASGKIGFLQQFTDDKTVLNAALERLKYNRDLSPTDRQHPSMSEYEAVLVERGDREVTAAFVGAYLREKLAINEEDALMQIQSRARTILHLAAIYAKNTYAPLEQLMRKSAQLPGRKVVFFISDGFFLDVTNTDSSSRLDRIADAAARANAVIYSFDAKGLDASWGEGVAATPRVKSGERWESQDPLNALAEYTGGRFIHNTNDLQGGLAKALVETSTYYLLAWRPDTEEHDFKKLRRIEVKVKGRPELRVRVQSGYLGEGPPAAKNQSKKASAPLTPAEAQIRTAFNSITPRRELPTSLVVNYLESPKDGPLLSIALQIKSDAVDFTQVQDKATAEIDLVGGIFNSQGKRDGYFNDHLMVSRPAAGLKDTAVRSDIYYNFQAKLKPGLYQIRTATRDARSGRTGSATQWLEIPDLASQKLALSSILLGESVTTPEPREAASATEPAAPIVQISVDRRLAGTSHLRYLLYIYNAVRSQAGNALPDVALQTQIFRDASVVMTSPILHVSAEGQDPSKLAYAAEIPLKGMPEGHYVLQVSAIDRIAKTSATRRVKFEVK